VDQDVEIIALKPTRQLNEPLSSTERDDESVRRIANLVYRQ
jgi:hypothetical protein